MTIRKPDDRGISTFYPNHPYFPAVMLQDAERRRDTRDIRRWREKVTQARHKALSAVVGGKV